MTEEEQVEDQGEKESSVHLVQMASALESLKNVEGKDYVEILGQLETKTQIKLRLRAFDLEAWTHQFLPVVFKEEIRNASRSGGTRWVLHICRQYMYDEDNDKLWFFWNFIVFSNDIEEAVRDLCRLIDMFVARIEDMKVPQLPPRPPLRRAQRPQAKKGAPVIEEDDLFTEAGSGGAAGAIVKDGQVISIPLLGKANRNVPEGGLFEKGKSPKGAHTIGGSK